MKKKILHLTLKKKWFDMILSGEKKEEYREIKLYWHKRLSADAFKFRHFDEVHFRNGYSKNAASIKVECKGIDVGNPNPKLLEGKDEQVYIIKLGNIINQTK